MPFLDAGDYARVAKNLFGVRSYRRPLAREVERLDPATLAWFSLFRGLVSIDWIIDALRAQDADASPQLPSAMHQRTIRKILTCLPPSVLRRILAEDLRQVQMALSDAARMVSNRSSTVRDLRLLPGVVSARGQKRVRGSRDVERLILDLPESVTFHNPRSRAAALAVMREEDARREMDDYNEAARLAPAGDLPEATWQLWRGDHHFRDMARAAIETQRRARMDARRREQAERDEARHQDRIAKQAQRHQWAVDTTARIDGARLAEGLTVRVATDAATLAAWGAEMNNCIGMYAESLELDVLAAVVDADGRVRLNLQITHTDGLAQILGKNNRNAADVLGVVLARDVVEGLTGLGVPLSDWTLGAAGLDLPALAG